MLILCDILWVYLGSYRVVLVELLSESSLLAGSRGRRGLDIAGAELGSRCRGGRDVEAMLFGLEQLAVARDLRVQVDLDVVQLLVLFEHVVDFLAQLGDLGVLVRDVLVVTLLSLAQFVLRIYFKLQLFKFSLKS